MSHTNTASLALTAAAYFLPFDTAKPKAAWSVDLLYKHAETYTKRNMAAGLGLLVTSQLLNVLGLMSVAMFTTFPLACAFGLIGGMMLSAATN